MAASERASSGMRGVRLETDSSETAPEVLKMIYPSELRSLSVRLPLIAILALAFAACGVADSGNSDSSPNGPDASTLDTHPEPSADIPDDRWDRDTGPRHESDSGRRNRNPADTAPEDGNADGAEADAGTSDVVADQGDIDDPDTSTTDQGVTDDPDTSTDDPTTVPDSVSDRDEMTWPEDCDELEAIRVHEEGDFCETYCLFINDAAYRCPDGISNARGNGQLHAIPCLEECAVGDYDCYDECLESIPRDRTQLDPSECHRDDSLTATQCREEHEAKTCWDAPATEEVLAACREANGEVDDPVDPPVEEGTYCETYCCFVNSDAYRCGSYLDFAWCIGRGDAEDCIVGCGEDTACQFDCLSGRPPRGRREFDSSGCFEYPDLTNEECRADHDAGVCWTPPED